MLEEVYIFNENSITLPQLVYDQVKLFADKSFHSNDYYLEKRKANLGRVKQQTIEGRLAEWAARSYLVQHLKLPGDVTPDMTVYPVGKKSWAADLEYVDYSVHVKCMTKDNADKFGESWLFQVDDPLFRNGLSRRDYVCFVLYDKLNESFNIRALVRWSWIYSNNLFKETKLSKFKSSKVAIYYRDLTDAYTNMR